jgi:cation channel sperm-associated protein 1
VSDLVTARAHADFLIVGLSFIEVQLAVVFASFSFDPKTFRIIRVFRAIRAVRALRALRTITFFRDLQIIVTTLLKSMPAWGSISMLLMLVLCA